MKESEIRPRELFEKYVELSRIDGENLDKSNFCATSCCACESPSSSRHFTKNNFEYLMCERCKSLFCSPRPNLEQLSEMYFGSDSSKYWTNVFFPSVQEVRREKLFRPKAQRVADLVTNKKLDIKSICDVGAGHGIFLDEIKSLIAEAKLFAVEPDEASAERCREKGIEVMQAVSEKATGWENKFDLVISSEVIEHGFSPPEFIRSLYRLVRPDGYCLINGLGYEGFDVLMLQEKSKSIAAPHHLNFMSINGFEVLFKNAGFRDVEVWTPGVLDFDIVANSGLGSELIRVIQSRGNAFVQKFQSFLSENQLSSHVWVLGKK